jgi:hypothetical protein
MKIRTEHKNIGAALMQIAEHEQFTAINSMSLEGKLINNAFKINNNIGLMCKYASEPNDAGAYPFTFSREHVDSVSRIAKHNNNTYVGLICVEDAEICCLSISQFETLVANRKKSKGTAEDTYQILVTVKPGKSFRVYVNEAKRKGKTAGGMITVPRSAFPDEIFK